MTWTSPLARAALVACALAALACDSLHAAMVNWDINPSLSSIRLSIPDQAPEGFGNKIGTRNSTGSGSSWTVGNAAQVDGFISTLYTENGPGNHNLQFLTNSPGSVVGVNSGNYRPNPAAFNPANTSTTNPDGTFGNTSTAAGVFGGKVVLPDVLGATAAYFSFRNVSYDATSGVIPVSGTTAGTFNANGINFGILQSLLDVDGVSAIIVGQLFPDANQLSRNNVMGANLSPGGFIQDLGVNLRQLTIPINLPLILNLDGMLVVASMSGTIVATAEIVPVPEPSTAALASLGLAAMAHLAIRRRKR